MILNETPIVGSPIIIFTQSDAENAVKLITLKKVKNYQSIVAVSSVATVEGLPNFAFLRIEQHGKRTDSGKERMLGTWHVKCPIVQLKLDDETRHIFKIDSKGFETQEVNGVTYDTAPTA